MADFMEERRRAMDSEHFFGKCISRFILKKSASSFLNLEVIFFLAYPKLVFGYLLPRVPGCGPGNKCGLRGSMKAFTKEFHMLLFLFVL
jgi:hypothetical protein